jgi:predicted RNase H-like HicB family nuclease
MRNYTAVVEKCSDTGLYVGYVPGFPGAHSQGETMDELAANLREVIAMLLEEGEPKLEAEFVGTQNAELTEHGLTNKTLSDKTHYPAAARSSNADVISAC